MIVFINASGDILFQEKEAVYQGSNNANVITIFAPFASSNIITVNFKLPNGLITTPRIMASTGEVNTLSLNSWQKDIDLVLTQFYGEVKCQFKVTDSQGVIVATGNFKFNVQKGTEVTLPEVPTQEIYDDILTILAQIQADILELQGD